MSFKAYFGQLDSLCPCNNRFHKTGLHNSVCQCISELLQKCLSSLYVSLYLLFLSWSKADRCCKDIISILLYVTLLV